MWLVDCPDAGYNPINSPHLAPAVALDDAILSCSRDIALGRVPKVSPAIRNESDLTNVMNYFQSTVLAKLKLWYGLGLDVFVYR